MEMYQLVLFLSSAYLVGLGGNVIALGYLLCGEV
jgi:hypothetical protein